MQNHRYIDFLKPQINNDDVRILLWDIDGTLLQSNNKGSFKEYFAPALKRTYGASGDFSRVNAAGKTDTQIVFQALASEGLTLEKVTAGMPDFIENLAVEMRKYLAEHENAYEILPGVDEILAFVTTDRNFKNALLTGNVSIGAKIKLEYVGLWHYFAEMPNVFGDISHDRRELSVAAGGLFAERFNHSFKPEQFIIIGDTTFDIDCARHFGAKAVCVETGRNIDRRELEAAKPDALIKNLSDTDEILRILKSL